MAAKRRQRDRGCDHRRAQVAFGAAQALEPRCEPNAVGGQQRPQRRQVVDRREELGTRAGPVEADGVVAYSCEVAVPGQLGVSADGSERLRRLEPAEPRQRVAVAGHRPTHRVEQRIALGQCGLRPDQAASELRVLVRQATELGADLIKCDPLPDQADFARVVRTARVPVLVRGGGRIADEEVMRITAEVLEAGAAGLVYGRNVIQHDDPSAMTRALAALVHEHATADAALARLA